MSHSQSPAVERWGLYDLALPGPSEGNPFADVTLSADFRYRNRVVLTEGSYDGGRYLPYSGARAGAGA